MARISQQASDLQRRKDAGTLAPSAPPVAPTSFPTPPGDLGHAKYYDGPLPADMWTGQDAQRQWRTAAVPQSRLFPTPPSQSPQSGAAASTQALVQVAPVATAAATASSQAQTASTQAAAASTAVAAVAVVPITTIASSGKVDPSQPYVAAKGSIPPNGTGPFSYTSTTSSVDVLWQSQSIQRADGTDTNITNSSQNVTGLAQAKSYYFYPYWDENLSALEFLDAAHTTVPSLTGASISGSTSNYLSTTTSYSIGTTTASVECWFHMTTGAGSLISFSTPQTGTISGTSFFDLWITGLGQLSAAQQNTTSTAQAQSGTGYNDGQWHHAVAVFATLSSTVTIYVDGVQVAQTTGNTFTTPTATHYYRVGYGTIGISALNGTVAHVAVYNNVALTAAQVQTHYNAMTISGPANYPAAVLNDSPTAYWELQEVAGSVATDSSATGTNGGTYQGSWTLNQSQPLLSPTGTPAIAWTVPSAFLVQFQGLQGRIPLSPGGMATATTASSTGGGTTGGMGGGFGGGCFTADVKVKTRRGDIRFDEIIPGDAVFTAAGNYRGGTVHCLPYSGLMYELPDGGFVTPNHPILWDGRWVFAQVHFADQTPVPYDGVVWNFSVTTDEELDLDDSPTTERSFVLACGIVAHNVMYSKS